MTINRPSTTKNIRCIYKFSFADNSYYIGSTEDLHKRLCNYKRNLTTKSNINTKIISKLEIYNEVTFEILEIVPKDAALKPIEQQHIRQLMNDVNILNSKRYFI